MLSLTVITKYFLISLYLNFYKRVLGVYIFSNFFGNLIFVEQKKVFMLSNTFFVSLSFMSFIQLR